MLKLVGLFIILIALSATAWWVSRKKGADTPMIIVCGLAILAGFLLIINERAVEITIGKVGTIKAAAQQALVDAQQIAEIRKRIEAQGATVDLVAKEAADAKRLTKGLSRENEFAEKKLKELSSAVKNSSSAVEELQAYTKFNSAVLAAQSDNRPAFDQLVKWAMDKSSQFSATAEQAWVAVMDSHESLFMSSGFKAPWKEGVDPSKLSLSDLKTNFFSAPQYARMAILEYIWRRQDFPKKERMAFLVEVMRNDTSLQIVEYAARYFKEESKDNFKNLYIDGHFKWWEDNKKGIE
ncbi:MAG: hypothetical protein HY283_02695 [Nitrospirae bacterium]|nr:hypothetical protein [Nitrospirota bacterium]